MKPEVSVRLLAMVLAGASCLLAAPVRAEVRVALLPIGVHAQQAETAYLSRGLAEMLAARLERYDGLVVVRPGSDAGPASGETEAVAAARKVDADYVLFGSFTRFGDGASLDLRCAPVNELAEGEESADRARRVFIQTGTVAEIIPRLDTLAEKVARYTIRGEGSAVPIAAAPGAAADNGAGGDASLEELLRRVDALERAVYAPVAVGGTPQPEGSEAGDATAVR